ncbi:hypothetical protein QLL95_gp0281 [Cotonvirus japonicus]|uniref:Uncharacterized protein n=1 Tax=Cotonvirus japonicus TaxID=2811091 RepID=A0ABM7NRI8_9VIRU|nr:hypothetical protein QLL95_gp0281 [Cotonvirus japonicus]BCS82770.1 hypothetical protein [Cotonvirus japonicus]
MSFIVKIKDHNEYNYQKLIICSKICNLKSRLIVIDLYIVDPNIFEYKMLKKYIKTLQDNECQYNDNKHLNIHIASSPDQMIHSGQIKEFTGSTSFINFTHIDNMLFDLYYNDCDTMDRYNHQPTIL